MVSDSQIVKIEIMESDCTISIVQYDKSEVKVNFIDCIGCEVFNQASEEVSDLQVLEEHATIDKYARFAGETASDFRLYQFIGAWTQAPIALIVAKGIDNQ